MDWRRTRVHFRIYSYAGVIMSIFDSATQWPDKYKACGAPHQSPINLSQSFAVPCDRLCEWTVDDSSVGEGHVSNRVHDLGGLLLEHFSNGSPTAKFNGDGYTCRGMILYSSAQHSLESVFGEGELVAYFDHPGGHMVCMSVTIRSAPGDTPSAKFFNAFVPYSDTDTQVKLGDTWSLLNVIPDTPSYYVYTGTTIWPDCRPDVTWIVYSNPVTMDPSDYAKLVKNVKPSRRPLEEVADREVTFFDAQGVTTPRDNKLYMRCRRVPKSGEDKTKKANSQIEVKKTDIEKKVGEQAAESNTKSRNNFKQAAVDQYNQMGGVWGILVFLLLISFGYLLFQTEMGKRLGGTVFAVVFFIPNLIRSFLISVFFTRRIPTTPSSA